MLGRSHEASRGDPHRPGSDTRSLPAPRGRPYFHHPRGLTLADALGVKPRGRSAAEVDNERLRRDNERLASELAKKDAALDVVGKVHALLEQLSESADAEPRSKP